MIRKIINGDCLELMQRMKESSVDSIVTDPPYGLSFMGKNWDHGVPGVPFWIEALRVLKPGGHLLAFGGSRTYHRLACAIEDAGFEIRDQIQWIYGSGFPKSLDVSKAIDKAAGVEFEARPASGVGFMGPDGPGGYNVTKNQLSRKGESTDSARQWSGWGTALKPAHEPIVMARKPLIGTVAENVQAHGTGAINVDGCRVGTDEVGARPSNSDGVTRRNMAFGMKEFEGNPIQGRWPANVIHDGSEEVVRLFPQTTSGTPGIRRKAHETNAMSGRLALTGKTEAGPGDSGSAARFFYCAKASKSGRGEGNNHPTVKPTDLMRYLCRLVTPPGGVVLDPFMGSGSTGVAARLEGFHFVGIEKEEKYCEIAKARLGA